MHASTSLSRYIISHHVTSRRNVNHRYATAGFSKLDHSSFLRVLTSYIYIYYIFETGIFRSFEKILLAFDPLSTRRGCGSIYSTLSRLETSGRARSINFLLSATTREGRRIDAHRSRIHRFCSNVRPLFTDPFRSESLRPPLSPWPYTWTSRDFSPFLSLKPIYPIRFN